MKEFIGLYFFGGHTFCELVKKPVGRYLCTVCNYPHKFSYDIYDPETDGSFVCVKSVRF